ncbi:MAG: bifunctional riboflavin kinase/FAD synthetase [Oscillospiraceae bacterium]|nr:bifunctional riboflavin kinase/FAD synthetase [Oscillospiraceae bacterium]
MNENKRAIALGFFDGIHIGHSALISKVLNIAIDTGLTPSVVTFDTHPQTLVRGETTPLITSLEDRVGLINRLFHIDDIIFLHFDSNTANMPWYEFIDHLSSEFSAGHLVAGHDFKFGRGGAGNSSLLMEKCREMGIGCDIIPEVKLDGITCSSTFIRELIASGDIERANEFLGHPHVLTNVVRYGYRLGRTLGSPTINMLFEDDVLVPAFGVYATKVYLEDGSNHLGVSNIGVRPTVDNSTQQVTAETHILDFDGNLYGRKVRIEFHKYIRKEIKFSHTDELRAQIQKDCISAKSYFR